MILVGALVVPAEGVDQLTIRGCPEAVLGAIWVMPWALLFFETIPETQIVVFSAFLLVLFR